MSVAHFSRAVVLFTRVSGYVDLLHVTVTMDAHGIYYIEGCVEHGEITQPYHRHFVGGEMKKFCLGPDIQHLTSSPTPTFKII